MATSMMKQRLIGAAVLIALGIIFIPMLLTGDGKFLSGDMESNVPPKPMYELEAPKVLPLDKRAGQPSDPVMEAAPETKSSDSEKLADASTATKPSEDAAGETKKSEATETEKVEPEKEKITTVKTQVETEKPATKTKTESESTVTAKTIEVAEKAQAESEKPKAAPKPSTTQAKVETRVETAKQKPIVSGWAVQLGSFSVQKNALNLRDKLRKNGHASFVEEYKHNGKTSYRVRVGPELTRDLAVALKKKLKTETKIDGFVVEFSGR